MTFVFVFLIFSLLYVAQIYYPIFRIPMITFLFIISSWIYFSFDSYKGWPTRNAPKVGSEVLWVIIREPSNNIKGSIFIWVKEKAELREKNLFEKLLTYYPEDYRTPRSYRLPFSKESQDEYSNALNKIKQGYKIVIGDNKKEKIVKSNIGEADGDFAAPPLKIISPEEELQK